MFEEGVVDLYNKSRMRGDFHVRFCERLGVKFSLPTRPATLAISFFIRTFTFQLKNNKKYILLIAYLLLWVILYNLPRRIFHLGGDNNFQPWIIYIILFFVLPILLYGTLLKFNLRQRLSKPFAMLSIFLAIPFALIIRAEDSNELNNYKKETTGVITKAWLSKPRKKSPRWVVQAQFELNGRLYRTTTKDDNDKLLQSGDTVTIFYSSKTPEINEIKELVEYYGE